MVSEKDKNVTRLDGKHLITLILIMILTISVLGTYVNAMMSYRPNIISQYVVFPPPNKTPVADAGSDQNVFVNETVYFHGYNSKDEDGVIVEYLWGFGDGEFASGVNVSHKYSNEGEYIATLTVTDDKNAKGMSSITITVSKPTPESLRTLTPEERATILEGISITTSLDIMLNLNSNLAAETAELLNTTTLYNIVETAMYLNQTPYISKILIEMEKELSARTIIKLEYELGARLIESMSMLNVTRCAILVETAVSTDLEQSANILELMETHTLLKILVEISRLPSSPSTVATIMEKLSSEKALELIKAWILTADIQGLGTVYNFFSSETLNNVFGSLTIAERASIYPYLSAKTVSLIQDILLPLPDITLTSFIITRLGSRGYNLQGTIENQGNTKTGTFSTDIVINENLVKQYEVSDLSVGNSTMILFEWKPTSRGLHTLKVIVDSHNIIEEIDETNNEINTTYGVELPDLTVSFTKVPTKLVEGKSYNLEVEISNIGEEVATDFNLTLQASGIIVERGQVRWISLSIGSTELVRLPSGSKETLDFSWEPAAAGAYTVVARADPLEQVLEGDKKNNNVELQVEVEERLSLWPYVLLTTVIAVAAVGVLLLARPQTLSIFYERLRNIFAQAIRGA